MGHDVLNDPALRRAREHRPTDPRLTLPAPVSTRKPGLMQKLRVLRGVMNLIHEIRMKKASWKTTLGGVIAAAGPLVKGLLPPEWHWVGDAMLSIGSLIVGASARDNAVTSEQARAK